MKCTEVKTNLYEYADNFLDDELKSSIAIHLKECQCCLSEFHSIKSMLDLMRQMSVPNKNEQQWQNMQQSILSEIHKNTFTGNIPIQRKKYLYFIPQFFPKWAVAALLVFSVISIFTLSSSINKNTQFSKLPRIVDVHGTAYTLPSLNSGSPKLLNTKSVNVSGNTLSTDTKASLCLQTDNKSFLEISENSSVHINECTENKQVFTLNQGAVTAMVGKRKSGQLYRIQTPNATCEVIGTRFKLSYNNQLDTQHCKTTLYVLQGKVLFRIAKGTSVLVDSGCTAIATNDTILSLTTNDMVASKKPIQENVSHQNKQSIVKDPDVKQSRKYSLKAELFSTISSQIDAGEFDKAINELCKIHSNSNYSNEIRINALHKEAWCWKMKRDYTKSISILNRIVNEAGSKKQKESALFQIASIRRSEMHDFDAAIKDLQQYLNDYPQGIWSEEVCFTLAELFHLKKNHQQATELYKSIISKYPESSRIESALYSLARIYSRDLNDCDRAFDVYSRIESQFPNSSFAEDALFWKAECLFLQKRITQSVSAFQQYLKKYPNGKWVTEAQVRSGANATAGIVQ